MLAGSVVALAVLVVASTLGLVRVRTNEITRVTMAGVPQVDEKGAPVTLNQTNWRAPFNILVGGTDDQLGPGRDNAARGDSMVLARVDMPANRVRMVSLPRDLWVTIADGSAPVATSSPANRCCKSCGRGTWRC